MKLASIILLLGIFAVSPVTVFADSGEMTKKEAKAFLQDLIKEKIEEGASKVAPKIKKTLDDVKKTIDRANFAASLCWDLIQLGLANDERKFATEFVKAFSKYIPQKATDRGGSPELGHGEISRLAYSFGSRLQNRAV